MIALTALCAPVSAAENHVMKLSAIGDYMVVPHSASLGASAEITVEYWLLFQNTSSHGRIGKHSGGDCQWASGPAVQPDNLFELCGPAIDVPAPAGFTNPHSEWFHFAATFNQSAGVAKVFLNGRLIATATGTAPMQNMEIPLHVGLQPGYATSQLYGSIDNFRIWTVERTQEQIAEMRFTEIAPGETKGHTGLVTSWTFESGASDSTGLNPGTLMGGASIVVDDSFYPNDCVADIIADGVVDGVDLATILTNWAQTPSGLYNADLDGSGIIDAADLAILLDGWGTCP